MSKKIENLDIYNEARIIIQDAYVLIKSASLSKDYFLRDQIKRSSLSILSNISEGFQRGTDLDFSRFLFMAKGSCGELKAQVIVALDLGYINKQSFDSIDEKCDKMIKKIGALIMYLRKSRKSI